MRLLLDTHLLIWVMNNNPKLNKTARQIIEQADVVYVRAASIWEIGIKTAWGKFKVNLEKLLIRMDEAGFVQLPVTWHHGGAVQSLPLHHRDPFDRMLVAQAISEPLRLLTHDRTLCQYSDLVKFV